MPQAQEFRESFDLFDTDGSGVIDAPELKCLLKAFGQVSFAPLPGFIAQISQFCQDMTEEQVKAMMMAVDADGSGEIDFDEFVCLVVSRMEHAMMNDEAQVCTSADPAILSALLQVRKAFNVFDGDGVGQISTSSLQAALAKR